MTRRESDHYGQRRQDLGADDTPLFAAATWTQRWASLTEEERSAQRDRWKALLLPKVQYLAASRAAEGITASDVISRGITDGVLNGERAFLSANPRVYSWVGAWLAQLAAAGVLSPKLVDVPGHGSIHLTRKSDRLVSHSNEGRVYLDPKVAA